VRLILLVALAIPPSFQSSHTTVTGNELSSAQVTVYGAGWCSACKSLEASLRSRQIPFSTVDVDENPGAYAMAKKAAGTNAIPLTNVLRGPMQHWIVGADPDAVEKAYNGG
jgi:mycoredoxin